MGPFRHAGAAPAGRLGRTWGQEAPGARGIFPVPCPTTGPTARLCFQLQVPTVSKLCPYLALSSFQVSRPAVRLCAPGRRACTQSRLLSLFAEPHGGSRGADTAPGGRLRLAPPQRSLSTGLYSKDTATQEDLFYSRFPKVAAARG